MLKRQKYLHTQKKRPNFASVNDTGTLQPAELNNVGAEKSYIDKSN